MKELLLFILLVFGCGYITTQSHLFESFREFFKEKNKMIYYLVNCIVCSTFWIGVIATLIFSPTATFELPIYVQFFLNGLIGSATSTIIYNFLPQHFN
jgi:hypothetical protein